MYNPSKQDVKEKDRLSRLTVSQIPILKVGDLLINLPKQYTRTLHNNEIKINQYSKTTEAI